MKALRLLVMLVWLLGVFVSGVHAQGEASPVLVLKADGVVAPAMQEYILRGIKTAEQRGAGLLVIELNTPGGAISNTEAIVTGIRASRVPVVVYVTPRGAMAASAGTLITLAGHAAAMSPETIIGAASAVDSQGQDLSETMRAKEHEALKALVRSLAARRGTEAVRLAESTIDEAKAFSAEEAKAAGLVDFIAADLDDLLERLHGFEVQMSDGPHTLDTANAIPETLPMTLIEELLEILVNPNIVFLLVSIGIQAILIELSSPGGWVAGFIGVVALALAAYGIGVLPINWFGFVFLALAFVLFVLDIQAPTHGALTAAGVGSFIVGALVLFNSPGTPQFQQVSLPLVIGTGVVIGVSFAGVMFFALRSQKAPPAMGAQTLSGKQGTALSKIDPRGQVQLQSEQWSAELADGADPVEAGEKVEVVRVDGLRLVVRKSTRENAS